MIQPEQITLYHIRMPLVQPFETSFGRSSERDCLLLEINSQGLTGWGECVADREPGYAYETTQTAWHIYQDYLFPTVLKAKVSQPDEIQQVMRHVRGHPMAKAGIEMAYWDLFGQQQQASLATLLGGERSTVPVGVSVGIQPDERTLIKVVSEYLGAGYQRIKLKIKPGRDIEAVAAIRREFPGLLLQVDANSAYRLPDASLIRRLDSFNLLMIEQPLAEDDLWDHHLLQKELATPLCLDESILTVRHARQALEMQACRIINIKSGRVGGLAEGKAIHDLCRDQGVPVWCGGMLETGVGRAANLALASLPGFKLPGDISATQRYYLEDITRERFSLNPDSTINVPQGSGLGVEVDRERLEKYTIARRIYRAA